MTEDLSKDTKLAASFRTLVFQAENCSQYHAAHMQV